MMHKCSHTYHNGHCIYCSQTEPEPIYKSQLEKGLSTTQQTELDRLRAENAELLEALEIVSGEVAEADAFERQALKRIVDQILNKHKAQD